MTRRGISGKRKAGRPRGPEKGKLILNIELSILRIIERAASKEALPRSAWAIRTLYRQARKDLA